MTVATSLTCDSIKSTTNGISLLRTQRTAWNRAKRLADGSSNGCSPGSIGGAASWSAGKSSVKPIKPFCNWPVDSFVFSTLLIYRFLDKVLVVVEKKVNLFMHNDIIIDSKLSKEHALKQNPDFVCPVNIISCQRILEVQYYSFDNKIHQGQIIVHEEVVKDVIDAFRMIFEVKFPITSVIPIADPRYHWDDELCMQANNSSGFNYRTIAGTDKLSNHAYGKAIDINPRLNPFIMGDFVQPKNAIYNINEPGTITRDSIIFSFFKERGWEWGGDWEDRKDYQHFEKNT